MGPVIQKYKETSRKYQEVPGSKKKYQKVKRSTRKQKERYDKILFYHIFLFIFAIYNQRKYTIYDFISTLIQQYLQLCDKILKIALNYLTLSEWRQIDEKYKKDDTKKAAIIHTESMFVNYEFFIIPVWTCLRRHCSFP